MWYKKYPKLNSALFTYENSGKRSNDPPPYSLVERDGELMDIEDKYSVSGYKILGYTENPPFSAEGYQAIAIMFENQDFNKVWWHYPNDEPEIKENVIPINLVIPNQSRQTRKSKK